MTCATSPLGRVDRKGVVRPRRPLPRVARSGNQRTGQPPDGVTLSSTFHWMFDRDLISIDDYSWLFKKNAVPDNVSSLVNRHGRVRVPEQ